jgi:hypothetical protein
MRGFSTSSTWWWVRSPMAHSDLPSEVIMKQVWPIVCPGAEMAWMPGRNSWPSLKNTILSRLGSRFLRAPSTNGCM